MGAHLFLWPYCCLIFSNIVWIDSYRTSPYFLFFRQVPKQRWVPKAIYWNNSKSKIIFKDGIYWMCMAKAYPYFKTFNFVVCVTCNNSHIYGIHFSIYFSYPFACIFSFLFFLHLGIQTLVSSQSARGYNKSDEDHYWIIFMICEIHVWKF